MRRGGNSCRIVYLSYHGTMRRTVVPTPNLSGLDSEESPIRDGVANRDGGRNDERHELPGSVAILVDPANRAAPHHRPPHLKRRWRALLAWRPARVQTLKRKSRTSPSRTTYSLP